jgi:hypothetical protein
MTWVGHVARMEKMRYTYKFFVGKPEGERPLRRLFVDKRVMVKWFLKTKFHSLD